MRLRGWIVAGGLGSLGLMAVVLGTLCLSSGCSSVGYLAQSVQGHLRLVGAARPVSAWLADEQPSPELRERLALSQRMRDFAVQALGLPDNRSYRSYADLGRPAAVWNVVAAPELSLELVTSCFPVVGCVGYRGYFEQAAAEAAGEALRAQGLEVSVYPVPAYSTLGKTNLLGGDPLLNTFIRWPEGELARLIFHELAHQVVYAEGDTQFNESFATAVERLGGERWLATQADAPARQAQATLDARRADFRALTTRARAELQALYQSGQDEAAQRAGKARILAQLRAEHAELKAGRWQGFQGYDAFIARANNASLGMQAAYHQWVPAFVVLFEQQGRDFPRFYAEVARLAALPADARRATLQALMPADAPRG
jgi:predicted aminopeptidase